MKIVLTAILCAAMCLGAHIEIVAGGGDASPGAPATRIKLVEPFAVAFGPNSEWYICEYKGERIIRVDSSGKTSVFAGTGTVGNSGDNGPAASATLHDPHGIVMDKDGMLYVADTLNNTIRRIDTKTGVITRFAGTGEKGFSGDGGPAEHAAFNGTFAIAIDPAEINLYVADLFNRRVRRIDLRTTVVSTVAGNGRKGTPADGADALNTPLVDPRAIAADSAGNLYILERAANALRVVSKDGKLRTVVGPGSVTPALNGPKHLCVDRAGNVIIADAENHLIRKYDPRTGSLSTIAGTGKPGSHIEPDNPLATELNRPHGVSIDPSGALYISDSYNHRILRLDKY
jgi:DNA-binding beta-propeller fold protein YncE